MLPSFLVMRIAAQWLLSEENLEDAELAWIDIGFIATDPAAVLLIASLVIAGIAARRGNATRAGSRG